LLSRDPVLFWNDVALDAALADSRAEVPAQAGPTRTSRAMAIVHAAIYDAWNGVERDYEPYLVHARAPRRASGDAAVARAAYVTLAALYPDQRAVFREAYLEHLIEIPNARGETQGIAHGDRVARRILHARRHDGSQTDPAYAPGTDPGQHRPDPLNPDQGFLTPGWGEVRPFAIPSADAFAAPAFPELTSVEYAAAFNEVRVKGALDAEVSDRDGDGNWDRTDDQTEIGIFWGYDHRLGTPVRLYNQAARVVAMQEGNSVSENARLFALLNIAMADAGIAAWNTKYEQNIWRPVVAIREADLDGNRATVAEADWQPLGAPANFGDPPGFAGNRGVGDADPDPDGGTDFTPPFPAYSSGHATFGAAAFGILASFYGTDAMGFELYSEDSGTTRRFDSFTQAKTENDQSRVFLGVHWSMDCKAGHDQGVAISDFVFAHYLRQRGNGRK
jgi:membrane-associated phospholipid phosphatase